MTSKNLALALLAGATIASGALGLPTASADRAKTKPAPAVVRHGKPTAPVTLTAVAERTAKGWQVVVEATPTVGVDRVELEIDGKLSRFGKTAAARGRRVVVPVEVAAGAGKDVVVAARVAGRSTAVIVRVGVPAPEVAAPAVTVRVVNGITIAEVRQ